MRFEVDQRVWWKNTENTVARGTVRELEERPGIQPDGEGDLLYLDADQLNAEPGVYRPGQPGYIAPGSPEHARLITPSKVAAILGEARWESPFSLWNRMKGIVPPEDPKTEFDIGHDMEQYMAPRWRRRHPGWRLSATEVQVVLDENRFGFPAAVTLDRRGTRGRARRVVEFKCARDISDLEKWGDDLSGECPVDYWSQVQAQMLFTGWTKYPAHLMAVGPFWNERVYEIEPDADVFALIQAECQRFWESLACAEAPPLDDSTPTYQTVRKLHPDITAGETAQLDLDTAIEYLEAVAAHKAGETRLRGAKTAVLAAMEQAQYGSVGELKVATRSPHASGSVQLNVNKKASAEQLLSLAGAE